MAKKLQILRGTTAQNDAYTGSIGELTMDTEKVEVRIHDGTTQGGKIIGSGGGASLPILMSMWSDRVINNMSWLRANTFSWHNSEPYINAYNHLAGGLKPLYAWVDRAGSYGFNVFTESETPAVGDNVYGENGLAVGTCSSYSGGALAWTGTNGTAYSAWLRETGSDFPKQRTENVAGISIVCNVTPDGLKICLPDQESNIVALYEKVGSANYFILDETNKQFKLPRTVQRKLIRAYKNGTTWYNLYSDGWVEQGGELASIVKDTTTTISLPLPFVDTNYSVGIIATGGVRDATQYTNGQTVQSKATDSFVMMARDYTFGRIWSACGYAQTTPDMGTEYEYYYVGNFEQSAVEQTAGVATKALNAKADIDLGNLPANFDYVVESQVPTADNGYTWFRKYKSGWVEQGGITTFAKHNANTSKENTVSLPVEMADTQYYVSAPTFITDAGNSQGLRNFRNTRGVTTLKIGMYTTATLSQSYDVQWRVSGYAAE